jgi:hypothetical protein
MLGFSRILSGTLMLAFIALGPVRTSSTSFSTAACPAPESDLSGFGRAVRDVLRHEYSAPPRFSYIEKRRDIDISPLGKVSVGPLRTFEVYPKLHAPDYKRLIAVDGKPLDAAELARRDEEHQRNLRRQEERLRKESPSRRAARLKEAAEEVREREEIFDDAAAVFAMKPAGRETLNGEPVFVVDLSPRPDAHVNTREGGWLKKLQGRMWVSEKSCSIARLRLNAFDDVSIGWGVVARVESGSGFDYVRKKIGDNWVPLELAIEGTGRTLLFRRFEVKTVTTYSDHRQYAQSDDVASIR